MKIQSWEWSFMVEGLFIAASFITLAYFIVMEIAD